MADAKYVVGDHRNGDAKVEIDAHKRTFSGLTKEELLKYQDDPFWVRLRWTMFVLFWALWLCMLAGAVVIIVQAPKCDAPKKWFMRGPLVELEKDATPQVAATRLPLLKAARAQALYVPAAAALAGADLYDKRVDLAALRTLADAARKEDVRIIVELVPNYVNVSHEWFGRSERSEGNYSGYFVWADADPKNKDNLPNNWVSTKGEPAWTWSPVRKQYYLHQYANGTADLNFRDAGVAERFEAVLLRWLKAGASGFRLENVRQLLVDPGRADNPPSNKPGATHDQYEFYKPTHTSDHADLAALLRRWKRIVHEANSDAVLSLAEHIPADRPYANVTDGRTEFAVDLPSADPVDLSRPAAALADHINALLPHWPALKFKESEETALEAGVVSALLPAAPVLTWRQIFARNGSEWTVDGGYAAAMVLRADAVVMSGNYSITAVSDGSLLACMRWMAGSRSFLMLWNPSGTPRAADAARVAAAAGAGAAPARLEVAALSHNYNVSGVENKMLIDGRNVTVSPHSAIILSFTPVIEK